MKLKSFSLWMGLSQIVFGEFFQPVTAQARDPIYCNTNSYPQVTRFLSEPDPGCGIVCYGGVVRQMPNVGVIGEGHNIVLGFATSTIICPLRPPKFHTCRALAVAVSEPDPGTVTSTLDSVSSVNCQEAFYVTGFHVRFYYSNGHTYDIRVSNLQYEVGGCNNLLKRMHLEATGDSLGIVSDFKFSWDEFSAQIVAYTEERVYTRSGGNNIKIEVSNIVYQSGIPVAYDVVVSGTVSGQCGITAVAENPDTRIPKKYVLKQNNPNPFNATTTIEFFLPVAAYVKLNVYDILGREVTALVAGYLTAGFKSVTWDGKNANGFEVASGVYFYRLESGEFTETKRMLLLK